jgi:hypothetical protein
MMTRYFRSRSIGEILPDRMSSGICRRSVGWIAESTKNA